MKYLFLIAALVLAAGPVAAADPKKPLCVCVDDCKCKLGDCPGKCPVAKSVKPLGNADDAWKAVKAGEKVALCIGVPAVEGAYATTSKKGHADGVYECFLHNGTPSMVPRVSAGSTCVNGKCYSDSAPSASPLIYSVNPFGQSCPNGQCPNQTAPRRR